MKKILSLTTTYPTFLPGDATPPFVHELNKRLIVQGLDIHVLAPRRPGTKLYEEQDGVKIHRYPYFFFSQWEKLADGAILPNIKKNKGLMFMIPFFLIMCFFNIIKLIAKEKISIIHSHRIITNGFIAALYKRYINSSIKLIITSHGGDAFLNKGIMGKIGNYMKRHTYSQIDTLTVVSNSIKELFQSQINEDHSFPIEVIPMGVDHHLFSTEKYNSEIIKKYNIDGPFILFVGRLAEKKGIKYLIDAMPMIIKEFPKTKCLIVGSGPLELELKNQANSLGLDKSIIFAGAIPNCDLPCYYSTSDVFVGPSIIAKDGDSEGFGLVFVEAIMSGAPVVGTNLLGIKDIIIQNKNGYLSHEKQSTSVSEGVIRLLNNNLDRVKVRETVLKFSWENISKKYYDLLQNFNKKMKGTVVITRYKEPNSILNDTLYSVSKQIGCKLNILMLDQFYNEDTELLCNNLNENPYGHVFEYRLIEPISLSYARNLGITESLNDIVMCIDPDAIASENRASSIIKCFENHKNTAIVGTKIIPKRNGKKNIFLFSSFFRADYSMLDLGNDIIEEVPKVIGASFSVHKGRLGNIKLFDGDLGRKNGNLLGGEETDLCKRVRKKGMKVTYNGEGYVLHQVSKERLSYSRIIKRVFWGGVSRALSNTKPEPHKIKRKITDYIFLPFYLGIYISGLIYGKFILKNNV